MEPQAQTPGIDYKAVLADLIAKRDALNQSIAGISALLGQSSGDLPKSVAADAGTKPGPVASSGRVDEHTFFGMAIGDAVLKFLGMVKKPQSIQEIMEALNAGGLTHSSKNFYNTVYTSIKRREDQEGDIIQVNKKWGLAAWFPGYRKKTKGVNGPDDDGGPDPDLQA